MLQAVIIFCLGIMSVALILTFIRLIKGPDLPDRILAMDTLYINGIAVIMLFGLYLDSNLFFEAALLIAVMGFISTVAISKHLMRGNIIE